MDERPLRQEKDERLDILERLQIEAADEIKRLRALLDQATRSANSTVRALVAADEREATLAALLTEARDELRDLGEQCDADWDEDLPARIDAALDGGAPCATCGGTETSVESMSGMRYCVNCGRDVLLDDGSGVAS